MPDSSLPNSSNYTLYVAAELRDDALVVRRCVECGALAATNHGGVVADRAMGRLPEKCRREHGNTSREQVVPFSTKYEPEGDR